MDEIKKLFRPKTSTKILALAAENQERKNQSVMALTGTYISLRSVIRIIGSAICEAIQFEKQVVRVSTMLMGPKEKRRFYQLAFGHHRLTAIKELNIESVEIGIHDMTDSIMLRSIITETKSVLECDKFLQSNTPKKHKQIAKNKETLWLV